MMLYLSRIRDQVLLGLKWCGDETHRRALVGAIVGGAALWLHKDLDSSFVDSVLLIVIPALTAAWSKHHPKIVVAGDGS